MISKHSRTFKVGLTAFALAAASLAQADTASLTIDLTGIQSNGEYGDPSNTVFTFSLGAGTHVTDVGLVASVTAFDPSYLSEMEISITPTDIQTGGVTFTPFVGADAPGSSSINDTYHLADYGLDFVLGADGIMKVEFSEYYQDPEASPNGIWNSGTLTIQYETVASVPEPASYGLMALGLAALGVVARRRRSTGLTPRP